MIDDRGEASTAADRVEELLAGLRTEERLRPRRVEEAVAFLGGMVSKHGLYRLVEADAIPHEKADGIPRAGASRSSSRLYFTFQDLARWRAAHYRPESVPRLERVASGPIQKTKAARIRGGQEEGTGARNNSTTDDRS